MNETTARPAYEKYMFVGTHGHVLALEKETGKTAWERSLPGTGYAVVAIVFEDGRLLCGTGGKAFALDPQDGKILWENSLRGMGMGVVFVTTAQSNDTEALMSLLAAQAESDSSTAATAGGAGGA